MLFWKKEKDVSKEMYYIDLDTRHPPLSLSIVLSSPENTCAEHI
jgi:hypothetical protein